jgi:histidinol-phosphate aminotransferase
MGGIPELLRPGMQRLCSNESPLGASKMAIAAATEALARAHEYPEGEGGDLIEAIATHFGVRPDRVRLGSGSDTLMMYATTAFAGPGDEVIFPRVVTPVTPAMR